jgi:hypothetical protein
MTDPGHPAEPKRICIAFDWQNDWDSRHLLGTWLANRPFPATSPICRQASSMTTSSR